MQVQHIIKLSTHTLWNYYEFPYTPCEILNIVNIMLKYNKCTQPMLYMAGHYKLIPKHALVDTRTYFSTRHTYPCNIIPILRTSNQVTYMVIMVFKYDFVNTRSNMLNAVNVHL